jgi:LytS/YehU family sensor histidine kinase
MIAIDDTEIIFRRFGIQSTTTILLVVADTLVVGAASATTASDDGSHTGRQHHHQYQQPLNVEEYKSITYTNVELMTLSDPIITIRT